MESASNATTPWWCCGHGAQCCVPCENLELLRFSGWTYFLVASPVDCWCLLNNYILVFCLQAGPENSTLQYCASELTVSTFGGTHQALGTVFVFFFLTASYYLMTSKVTAKASVLFTTTCAFGMLISLLQSIGIIGTMTVEFPVNISSFFGWFSILLLDLDNFGFACLAGSATALRYSASVLFFPAGIAWYMLNYGAPWHCKRALY